MPLFGIGGCISSSCTVCKPSCLDLRLWLSKLRGSLVSQTGLDWSVNGWLLCSHSDNTSTGISCWIRVSAMILLESMAPSVAPAGHRHLEVSSHAHMCSSTHRRYGLYMVSAQKIVPRDQRLHRGLRRICMSRSLRPAGHAD